MKLRLLIRALCVGAALLVPAGGLTTLGVTTAGATTNQELLITNVTTSPLVHSTAKLGSFGSAILSPIQCQMNNPTKTQCILPATPYPSHTTKGITITKGGSVSGIKLHPVSIHILVTQSNTNLIITAVGVKLGSGKLTGTSYTHCKIATIPAASLATTSGVWKASGISMATVKISTTGGTCTKKSTLTNDFTSNLSITLKLSTKAI